MKITKIDIVHATPRFSLLTLHTDNGLIGYGEAIDEGKSRAVEMAVREMEPYLIGQDPRRIEFLWQALYRSSFYRCGPVLNSAISGLEQAMWDILGKSLNAPVYVLLGGAVRDKIRMYEKLTPPIHTTATARRSGRRRTAFRWSRRSCRKRPAFSNRRRI